MMCSTSQYTHNDLISYDPNAPDPIWELVDRYRRICSEKKALHEEILCELDKPERGAELEVENVRMARVVMRYGTTATDRRDSSTWAWAWGNHRQGERPVITDLDGPREGSIRNSDIASRGVRPDQLTADTSNLPLHARMGAAAASFPSPTLWAPITLTALIPDEGPSTLPAGGSVFAKYNKMIAALQTRSPPISPKFIPRKEIPWPLLSSDGVFPVAISGKKQIKMDGVADFATGYALWGGKPLRKALNILLEHWTSMVKQLSVHPGTKKRLQITPEVSETLRWIVNVHGKLSSIAAEQERRTITLVFTTYEQQMTLLAQVGSQLPPFQAIPWPVLPGLGEQYPAPAPGSHNERQKIGRFVQAYSTWKSCSKANICARMLSEWEALHKSCTASDARTKQCIKGVVNYLAEYN